MIRTRNSLWNLATGTLYAAASAAAGLLAAPLLLRWLGAERLGAYKALTDWFAYLTFFEVGVSGALMALLAKRIGREDDAAVTRMLAAGWRAYRVVAIAQLAAGLALTIALPALIPTQQASVTELRTAGLIALLPACFTPFLAFRALAEARQRGYLNWLLMTAQVLTMNGLWLFTAWLGWGLIGQSLAFTAAQIPVFLVLAWDGGRAYRGIWKTPPERPDWPEREDRGALWRLSGPTYLHGLTDRIGLVSDNILIAWMLGPAAVAPFFLTQYLPILAQAQLRGIGQATWAGLADLHARGEAGRLQTRLLELTRMVSGLGWALLPPIAIYNPGFVHLWVGREGDAGAAVTGLACFNAWLWAIYALWGWTLLGAGVINRWMPFAVAATLVNLTVSVVATATVGLAGPLLGTAAGQLLIGTWALPRVLARVFGIPLQQLWRAALIPMRWGLPYGLGLWSAARFHPRFGSFDGWLELSGFAALSSAAGLALWWRFDVEPETRASLRARLDGAFRP